MPPTNASHSHSAQMWSCVPTVSSGQNAAGMRRNCQPDLASRDERASCNNNNTTASLDIAPPTLLVLPPPHAEAQTCRI
jgi:hypothetical protein